MDLALSSVLCSRSTFVAKPSHVRTRCADFCDFGQSVHLTSLPNKSCTYLLMLTSCKISPLQSNVHLFLCAGGRLICGPLNLLDDGLYTANCHSQVQRPRNNSPGYLIITILSARIYSVMVSRSRSRSSDLIELSYTEAAMQYLLDLEPTSLMACQAR